MILLIIVSSAAIAALLPTLVIADGNDPEPNFWSHFGASLGISYEYGSLGDTSVGLASRSMGAIGIEALPGFRLGSWLFGADFQYQNEWQNASLSSSGGTNLAGNGLYFGLGTHYRFSSHFALQGSVSFIGRYSFAQQNDPSLDDHLSGPLGFRVRGQYFVGGESSPFSLDLTLQYIKFNSITVISDSYNYSANQWMIGVGASLHFPASRTHDASLDRDEPSKSDPQPIGLPLIAPE